MRCCSRNLLLLLFFIGCSFFSCKPDLPSSVQKAYEKLPETIDFNFHIRPILSDRCFSCHGPDENTREGGLRLDVETDAFARLSSGNGFAFVSGSPGKSEAVHRILSPEDEYQMPPPSSNLFLSDQEKAMIIKWIDQGAEWKEHWAFIPPKKVDVPELSQGSWNQHNEIDAFIQAQLSYEGLNPSAEADKERLLRRLSMDLTGLPPTVKEIEQFLADDSEQAYEKVVDRLLASDAHAERLAMEWMDISRYADSHGMHADGWRMMWPWRDWVIKAFKGNMSYDKFVSWQLAGDLMPNATKDQKIATAFNRNHPMTAEGGVIDEEFRLGYVFDRTETVATAFMGLTMGCARCHDHKFDPISQKEYYEFTAFFNQVKELGMTGDDGNYGPMLSVADSVTEQKLAALRKQIAKMEREEITSKLSSLGKKLPKNALSRDRLGYFPLNKFRERRKGEARPTFKNGQKDGGAKFIIDNNKASVSNGQPKFEPGVKAQAIRLTGDYDEIRIQNIKNFEWTDPFSAALWMNTGQGKNGETQTLMGTSGEKNNFWRGWDFYLDTLNRLNARIIHSLPHNYIHLRTLDSVKTNTWYHTAFAYDGSGKANGFKLYIGGEPTESEIVYDNLYKSSKTVSGGAHIVAYRPVLVGRSGRAFTGESGFFRGLIDDIYIYDRELQQIEILELAGLEPQEGQYESLLKEYIRFNQKEQKSKRAELKKLRNEFLEISDKIPEIMVMEEMPKQRATFAYNRGEYDAPLYEVAMATPEVLHSYPKDIEQNRLGLTKWLFSPDNPLTARVTVNRYWQMIFGKGLVNTPQDFGVQGALPTHPELLDWLAVDYIEHNWDLRYLLKTMVMSATYRQSSEITPEALEKDPDNVWLARGPSYRLPAEMIRDNALAASGLLVQKVGGESVRPYQPEGLWIEKGNFSYKLLRYKVTKGDSLYRRSLYTFVKRTSPHPSMTAFDAPNRDVCTVKRENTNTPLQALVLLNDPQFVEAARVLAERVQLEQEGEIGTQINHAFRLCTGRNAKEKEVKILEELYEKQLKRFEEKPAEALELLTYGEHPRNQQLDAQKTAALAVVSSTILNHDEAYMKR